MDVDDHNGNTDRGTTVTAQLKKSPNSKGHRGARRSAEVSSETVSKFFGGSSDTGSDIARSVQGLIQHLRDGLLGEPES